jgi:hypothetical protein
MTPRLTDLADELAAMGHALEAISRSLPLDRTAQQRLALERAWTQLGRVDAVVRRMADERRTGT